MKRLFHLMIAALAAAVLFSGCQKYDDTEIRQALKELGDRVTALETWCRSSQEAIDNVAKLKEAVEGMKSVKSVDAFDDDGATGYVITFTDGQSIKLYNGKDGNDGDTFFGKVEIGTECVIFTLADGSSFTVRRVKPATIGFDSYETKTIARGDTLWTVMNPSFTKANFAAFTAELMTEDGTATTIATKSAATDASWKIEAVEPEFKEDGSLARPAGIVVAKAPQTGGKGVLKVAVIDNEGREETSSLVVDVAPNYLSFEAVEAGATVSMEIVGEVDVPSLFFSTDLKNWTAFDFGNPQTITLENVGDKVYWRNTGKTDTFSRGDGNYIHFVLGKSKIAAGGNIMSLVDGSCESKTISSIGCFVGLFSYNAGLTTAPELPAEELARGCYYCMFRNCTSLVKAPRLDAMSLARSCYCGMFMGCSSLENALELPAKILSVDCYCAMFANCESLKEAPDLASIELADSCCYQMFAYCSSLEKVPALPVKELAVSCYNRMFMGCSSLENAPELPAEELAESCYNRMFMGCSSLENAPELPATTLSVACYYAMFANCESLKEAPAIPASELPDQCCYNMFQSCSSLIEAPDIPATKVGYGSCYSMFSYCTSLEKAPELPATELAPACYFMMFSSCTSLEKAPELPALELKEQCYYGMFAYTAIKKMPELPATKLADYCYGAMFQGSELLEEASELPATELADGCYYAMFYDCVSLTKVPSSLPAKKLEASCYEFMFAFSNLKEAPELPATELAPECYLAMFTGCYEMEKAPELPAKKLEASCYESMFDDCPKLNYIKVAFEDWGEDINATAGWVLGVGSEGTFEGPEGLEVKYGDSFIPTGWSVNGAAPAAATKSFAAPTTKSVRSSLCKPLASKTPGLQKRILEPEMITL